jgi:hypothetical protein
MDSLCARNGFGVWKRGGELDVLVGDDEREGGEA